VLLLLLLLQLKQLHKLDLSQLQFVGESLKLLRQEVGDAAAVLGE
jgi:uroporphyrinogen decarboxylase